MPINAPMKRSGFNQELYSISATKKEEIGTLRITQDGRKFRYARAGATLSAGKMGQAVAIAANVMNEAPTAADVIGETSILFTAGGAVSYAENYFAGGHYHINAGAGPLGHSYPIKTSSAVSAGTAIYIELEQGLLVANIVASTKVTLVHSPWMGVIEAAVEENLACGVPLVAVTDQYYYWAQTGGAACALTTAASGIGTGLILSATVAGSLDAQVTPKDVDEPVWAVVWGTAGEVGCYKPVWLTID